MLDPTDWQAFRATAHRMLDDALDGIAEIRESPAWRVIGDDVKSELLTMPLPEQGTALADVYADYERLIAPYATGNRHPRFFGWVHGGGTPSGMVAEMLAAGLDSNTGGRDHAATYVERAVIAWWSDVFGFPERSSGIVTSGTSIATLCAVLIARQGALGAPLRETGVGIHGLSAYAGANVHHCAPKAFSITGLGSDTLRLIALDERGGMDIVALRRRIDADRRAGLQPFMLIATAGSVDCAAFDDIAALADLAAEEKLWLHVDGAFGGLARIAPSRKALLDGIERADSLAFDFHKWLHVPYGAGMVLTRHPALHYATFADEVDYLRHKTEGTAGGDPWFCDFGPELSRRFRALSVWFTMREFGLERLGAAVDENCRLAAVLGEQIAALQGFVLLAPVYLNIVCARFVGGGDGERSEAELDAINDAVVVRLQTSGVAVPSTTRIDGRLAIRFNLTNHRITASDIDVTVNALREAAALAA